MEKGSRSFDRKDEFKKGLSLESGTSNRVQRSVNLRKQKKEQRLRQRRNFMENNASQLYSEQDFQSLLKTFDQQAVLQTNNYALCLQHVTILNNILQFGSGEPAERYLRNLFCTHNNQNEVQPTLLYRLIDLMKTTDAQQQELVNMATWCLANLTGTKVEAELWASEMQRAEFLSIAAVHLDNPNNNVRFNVWLAFMNMCLVSDQTRDAFIDTEIPQKCKQKLVECISGPSSTQNDLWIATLMSFVCAYMERGEQLPPWNQVQALFPICLELLQRVPATHFESMPSDIQDWITYTLGAICAMDRASNEHDVEHLIGRCPLIEVCVELTRDRKRLDVTNYRRCMDIISMCTSFSKEYVNAAERLLKVNAIPILHEALLSNEGFTQKYAAVALSCICGESVDAVFAILEHHVLEDVMKFKNSWINLVNRNLAAMISNMIQMLYPNSQVGAVDRLDQRHAAFMLLVKQYRVIPFLCDQLRKSGNSSYFETSELPIQILDGLGVALFWEEHLVKSKIEDCGGLTRIEALLTDAEPNLFAHVDRFLQRFFSNQYYEEEEKVEWMETSGQVFSF